MLNREQIDSGRALDRSREIIVVALGVMFTEGFVALLCHEMPQGRFVSALGLGFALSAIFFYMVFALLDKPYVGELHLRNTIGYQLVWMLDKEGEPDNRVERRDLPLQLMTNTSEWALYEPLGGLNRRMFIASRAGKGHDKLVGCSDLRITRIKGEQCSASSTVCVHNTRTGEKHQYSIWNLLRILNETDGNLGDVALFVLFRELKRTRAALMKATEEARTNEALRAINAQEIVELTEQRRQMQTELHFYGICLKIAMRAINEAADALAKRSVRNKDVIKKLEDQMTRLQKIAASEQVTLPPLA